VLEEDREPDFIEVTSLQEFKDIMSMDILTVACFWADDCGPCKLIEEPLKKIAEDFPDVVFALVDADKNPEIIKELNVKSLPTWIIARSGEYLGDVVGAKPDLLIEKIKNIKKNLEH
uniref:de novo designed protein n=1 Tax=synthetic construct TaxID=32630 RepID=UPI00202BBAE3|nr:Chain A, de novo designed protein [synthetic construct]7VQW_B Chain B, de novo designed protein [synthetic construct]